MSGIMALAGRRALVTGAASGIGRAIAISLANRGCHLALADIDESGLAATAAGLPPSIEVARYRLDVSDPAAIAAFPARLLADHATLDLLVNNAGVALGGTFEDVAPADFEWLFSINFWGVVRMTRAFLPILKASAEARIVNISSVFGLIAPPGQTAYVASKFAVRGFSESLRHELKRTNVGMTVVHPGGVATAIAMSARVPAALSPEAALRHRTAFHAVLKMPPALAGETIVKAVERRRPRVIVGNDAKMAALLERVTPVSYMGLINRLRG